MCLQSKGCWLDRRCLRRAEAMQRSETFRECTHVCVHASVRAHTHTHTPCTQPAHVFICIPRHSVRGAVFACVIYFLTWTHLHMDACREAEGHGQHTHARALARKHIEQSGFLFSWQQHVYVFDRKHASREEHVSKLAVGSHVTGGNTRPPR